MKVKEYIKKNQNEKYPLFNAVRHKRRQYKYLYRKMLDKNIILQAYKNLRKGKTKRIEIQYIDQHLDEEIEKIQQLIYYTRKEFENTEYYAYGFFSNTINTASKKKQIIDSIIAVLFDISLLLFFI